MRSSFFCLSLAAVAVCAGCSSNLLPAREGIAPSTTAVAPQDRSLSLAASATPKPTPTPSATPAVYPLLRGETYGYTYSYSAITTAKGQSTIKNSYEGSVTAQLSGLGSYNGNPAYTLRTTGTSTSGNATLDHLDYINVVASGGHMEFVEYGYDYMETQAKGSGVVEHDGTKLTYATPFVYDELPETRGASWPESVALKETINDYDTTSQNNPNVLSGTLTEQSDGSYDASGKWYDVPETRHVSSNGTGYIISGPSNGSTEWSYGLPQAGSSGEVIPATESYAGQSATNLVPDWYPGGGAPLTPLATESTRDLGQVAAPATCGTQAKTVATHIAISETQLDPVAGFTATDDQNLYVVPGTGYICKLEVDTQRNYDTENTGALTSTKTIKTSQILTSYTP